MSNSDSSDDDLGLFSFANKRAIVSTPPDSPESNIGDTTSPADQTDKSLFVRNSKRKRYDGPRMMEQPASNPPECDPDTSISSVSEGTNCAIVEKIKQYDTIVDNIW